MKRPFLIAIATVLLAPTSWGALIQEEREMAAELYKKFVASQEDLPARTEIVDEMVEIGSEVAKVIHPIINKEFLRAQVSYLGAFKTRAKTISEKKKTKQNSARIKELRSKIQALRNVGGLSKEMIEKTGDPALSELRELTQLDPDEIFNSNEAFATAKADLLELGKQRNACIDALVLIELEPFEPDTLADEEKRIAATALSIDRDAQKILDQNRKLAEKVEPAEAEGIADLNELRILIGLRPCLIDPPLCAAARGHSSDMGEKGFFAHESPVPGKKTPWMRAKLEGTSANSENIFVGSSEGKAANKAWWYSPGHHKNMLAPKPRRVGMGLSGTHWTQMFGG